MSILTGLFPIIAGYLLSSPPQNDETMLSAAEADRFALQIQQCWSVPTGDATAVTVSLELHEDGTVLAETIALVSPTVPQGEATEQSFQAARRAILRCQGAGYDLPVDKYAHWREIELTFDPESMRLR